MAAFDSSDIAFVTGAGSGIGKATCILLAEQGATVVAVDINKSAADQTVQQLKGTNHTSIRCDVASSEDVEAAVNQVKTRYNSAPNIAVNCAGIMLCQPVLHVTEETFNREFDINVKGTVWVTKTVCRELLAASRKGSIVNIASIFKQGAPFFSIYSACKGAVMSFSSSVAKELASKGIRVNSISPGGTDTQLIPSSGTTVEMTQVYIDRNPMKRFAKPEEIAEAIVFLASEKASYVTGTDLYVHGGHI